MPLEYTVEIFDEPMLVIRVPIDLIDQLLEVVLHLMLECCLRNFNLGQVLGHLGVGCG